MTTSIRTTVMRGGTSRGLVVQREQLSSDPAQRDEQIRALFGSPHPYQVDGLGGGVPPTSKLALVGAPSRDGADIDYTFAQVGVADDVVDFSGTCGNLSAAVALYAVEEAIVSPGPDGVARVTVHNTNTGDFIVALVPTEANDEPGAERAVFLDYADMAGDAASVLPTGRVRQHLKLEDGESIEVTLANVGNAQVYVRASDVGITGSEAPIRLDADAWLTGRLELIRRAGRAALAAAGVPGLTEPTRLPLVSILASASDDESDIALRLSAVGRIHQSIAGSAAVSAAAVGTIEDTLVHEVARTGRVMELLRIAHPAGIMRVRIALGPEGRITELAYERTARRIMEGTAYV